MGIALTILLFLWFLLSILNQCGQALPRRLARYDPFHLLPRFTFFAPNPGRTDYHLYYRSESIDSTYTPWLEHEPIESRPWYTSIWNPRKRFRKILADIVRSFLLTGAEDAEHPDRQRARALLSLPYLALLNLIVSLPDEGHRSVARQFAILQSHGFLSDRPPAVLFRSEFHRLRDD